MGCRLHGMAMIELPVRQRGACCELPPMPSPQWAEGRAALLRAVADPTRLAMVACLWSAGQPVCICDFTATFELSQPTISHHMAKLKAAGLVESEKRGIWSYYRLKQDLPESTRELLRVVLDEGRDEERDRTLPG
jgi:ArsR family transcriptional regulator, arsenate/arsenite/antimonite-responsive transcriptional repressor